MGVPGLWHLVRPSGRYVDLENLAGLRVAVDVSGWLYQFLRIAAERGEPIAEATVVGVFSRLCRMLHFGLAPVLVFDGPAPEEKRRVLKRRRELRNDAQTFLQRAAENLLIADIKRAKRTGDHKYRGSLNDPQLVVNASINEQITIDDRDAVAKMDRERRVHFLEGIPEEFRGFVANPRPVEAFDGELQLGLNKKNVSDESSDLDLFETEHSPPKGESDRHDQKFYSYTTPEGQRRRVFIPLDKLDTATLEELPEQMQYQVLSDYVAREEEAARERCVRSQGDLDSFSHIQVENYMRALELQKDLKTLRKKIGERRLRDEGGGGNQPIGDGDDLFAEDNNAGEDGVPNPEELKARLARTTLGATRPSKKLAAMRRVEEMEARLLEELNDYKTKGSVLYAPISAAPVSGEDVPGVTAARVNSKEYPLNTTGASSSIVLHIPVEDGIDDAMAVAEACMMDDDIFTECLNASEYAISETPTLTVDKSYSELDGRPSLQAVPKGESDATTFEQPHITPRKGKVLVRRRAQLFKEATTPISSVDVAVPSLSISSVDVAVPSLGISSVDVAVPSLSISSVDVAVPSLRMSSVDVAVPSGSMSSVDVAVPSLTMSSVDVAVPSGSMSSVDVAVPLVPNQSDIEPRETKRPDSEIADQISVEIVSPVDIELSKSVEEVLCKKRPASQVFTEFQQLWASSLVEAADVSEGTLTTIEEEIYSQRTESDRKVAMAETITPKMIEDIKTLCGFMGIPFIAAPSEAEAQCAFLSMTKGEDGKPMVDIVCSDDSDALVFGAPRVVRRLFSSRDPAELYDASELHRVLGLTNFSLRGVAAMLGSDYHMGVRGIGVVNAMETVATFLNQEELRQFSCWAMERSITRKEYTDIDPRWRRFMEAHENYKSVWRFDDPRFPDIDVWDRIPVERSLKPFSWAAPDVEGLFAMLRSSGGVNTLEEERLKGLWLYTERNRDYYATKPRDPSLTLRNYFTVARKGGPGAPRLSQEVLESKVYGKSIRLQNAIKLLINPEMKVKEVTKEYEERCSSTFTFEDVPDEGRVLTLHQPWASLLVFGVKCCEGRDWKSKSLKGWVWVHSSKRRMKEEDKEEVVRSFQQHHEKTGKQVTFPSYFPTGTLLGRVWFIGCLASNTPDTIWSTLRERNSKKAEDNQLEFPSKEKNSSKWLFLAGAAQRICDPLPLPGKQRIWKLTDDTLVRANSRLVK